MVADPFTFHENTIWRVDSLVNTDPHVSDEVTAGNRSARALIEQLVNIHVSRVTMVTGVVTAL